MRKLCKPTLGHWCLKICVFKNRLMWLIWYISDIDIFNFKMNIVRITVQVKIFKRYTRYMINHMILSVSYHKNRVDKAYFSISSSFLLENFNEKAWSEFSYSKIRKDFTTGYKYNHFHFLLHGCTISKVIVKITPKR